MISTDFRVEPADYTVDFADLRAVREPVFVIEQQVPIEEEWDELDPRCHHVIARDNDNRPIGTGRLTPNHTIGRMAVLPDWRGKGVGKALLLALLDLARQQGWTDVSLHAQTHAIPFYAGFGFVAEGDIYLEAGIPHRTMHLALAPLADRQVPDRITAGASSRDIQTASELLDATLAVIADARRELCIFTPDLEYGLYGRIDVLEALRQFVTNGRQPRLRILVQDPRGLAQAHHPAIELAQRLPSVVLLRTPQDPEDQASAESFLLNDMGGYIHRATGARPEGRTQRDGRARARQLLEAFDTRWERARPLDELRALGG